MASVNQNTEVIKGGASGPPAAPNVATSHPKTTLFVNLQLMEHVDGGLVLQNNC